MREQTQKESKPRGVPFTSETGSTAGQLGGRRPDRRRNFVLARLQAENATLRAEQTRLREALQSLRNEVAGSLGAWENHLAQLIGVTNVRCLQRKVEEADAALSSTPTPEHQ